MKPEVIEMPIVIMGESFKPNIGLIEGSPSRLLRWFLKKEPIVVDPFTRGETEIPDHPAVFFIAVDHDCWKEFEFPDGS